MSTVKHATWALERTYPVPPARVFAAWADPEIKARWFVGADGKENKDLFSDFRVGGRETAGGAADGGSWYSYEAVYRDIVEDERIVTTYEMAVDGKRISVSIATVEFLGEDTSTRLIYTEQGAYLDDLDQPEWRQQGTAHQFDRLGGELERAAVDPPT